MKLPPTTVTFFILDRGCDRATAITIAPGETFERAGGGPDDEGWSRWGEVYKNTGEGIEYESFSEGQDCDGRVSSAQKLFCPYHDLDANHNLEDMGFPAMPLWQSLESSQRDFAAEAAGY